MANMKVEVVSLVTTDSKQTNLENFLRYMDDAAEDGAGLGERSAVQVCAEEIN